MNPYSLFQVGDEALERDMLALFAADGPRFALEIAHIAEFDARRLYAREGYPSMFDYCLGKARLSDDAALKRIRAARAAREHPELSAALAEGRLHLTAVVLLAPKLARDNVDELIAAATHRTVEEIRTLLAERFPRRDVPLSVRAVGAGGGVVLKPVDGEVVSKPPAGSELELVAKPVEAKPKVAPLAPGRYETRFTMGHATHEALRYFEQLLGRRVTSEELDRALARGFKAMAAELEKRRFGATDEPRKQSKAARGRHIPNAVKREVWQRDEGRCTFVAENGRRCERRGDLEFDHIEAVARGGKSTAENLRLRCRAHNQYEAERAFGAGFMHEKREWARGATPVSRQQKGPNAALTVRGAARRSPTPPAGAPQGGAHDVTPWLVRLGFRKNEAEQAAAHCGAMPDASLEERVKAALSFLRPPARTSGPPPDPDRRAAGDHPPTVARGAHRISTSLPAGPS
jgi:hypothetical protein